ncbi:MAG: DUF92 domain-containing protein [Flavisolibacter sp.]
MQYFILILFLAIGGFLSAWTGKLTIAGAITGVVLGFLLYCGAGWTGLALMAAFFILGTVATSWKHAKKERLGIAEKHQGRRKASQVLANGSVGALCALLAYIYPQQKDIFHVMIAAAFSSATADTLSSELGTVYGKKFYNILSFKKDTRGLDGVISAEGTICGIMGSCIIALVYAMGFGWSTNIVWIIIAGTIGNLSDSLLGASVERRHVLNNDAVNFLNTLIAALAILIFV